MNKSDIKLVAILFSIIIVFVLSIFNKEEGETAIVYYEDKEILKIDLNDDKEYTVDGELGDVIIEVKNKKVRVKKENSPKNICSKQGYIGDNSRTLICLPNKIVIKIVGDTEIDGVVY